MTSPLLAPLLKPNTPIRQLEPHLFTGLATRELGAPYDSKAAAYDRLVSSDLYLKLAWGARRQTILTFMRDAFAAGDGPILDLAAGTSVDAVDVYPASQRTIIVADLSLEMLKKGKTRLITVHGSVPDNVVFLQADALDLPFKDQVLDTLLCHGAFHLLPDLPGFIAECARVLCSNGGLFVSSLVTERTFGNLYLKMLHRSGEVSRPMSAADCAQLIQVGTDRAVTTQIEGNFAYLRC